MSQVMRNTPHSLMLSLAEAADRVFPWSPANRVQAPGAEMEAV
jgi:hypothetical protein